MSDSDDTSWKDSSTAKKTRKAGQSLSAAGQNMISDSRDEAASKIGPVQYRKGGKIRKGKSRGNKAVPIIAHENERVIPANKRKKTERLMKRAGMSLTNKKRGKGRSKAR